MLVMFVGPPLDRADDNEAVSSFINDTGEKVILGGTTSAIFERNLRDRTRVEMKTTGGAIPPYGFLGDIFVTEGTITLQKLNDVFFSNYSHDDAVGLLKDKITKHERIKIYHGRAVNPVNGIDKNTVVAEFVKHLRESGKSPEIVNF